MFFLMVRHGPVSVTFISLVSLNSFGGLPSSFVNDNGDVCNKIGTYLKAEQLRILLALMVILVCAKLALDLLIMPSELYSIGAVEGH